MYKIVRTNKNILSVRKFSNFTENLQKSINNRRKINIEPEILKYNEVENLIELKIQMI